MRVSDILQLEHHLMPDYAHPVHPLPYKHTYTNKKDTVCLMTSARPTFSPKFFFQFPSRRMYMFSHHTTHHDECTCFLITQLITTNVHVFSSHNCPKIKIKTIYSISLESSHKLNSTVPIFNKSKKSIQMNGLAPRALWFHTYRERSVPRAKNALRYKINYCWLK